jgi:membrane protein required for beta-lactamase induction
MSSHTHGGIADVLGKVAMRIICATIVLMAIVVLIAKGIDGFPFGVWGLVGAAVLAVVSAGVGEVK